jgi:nucleotide-binding universal stress UspA family protein
MDDSPSPMLICYDGSDDARRAIDRAASLLVERPAVVIDVAPPLTVTEAYASIDTVPPPFEEWNIDEAAARAEQGAELARTAGLSAKSRGAISAPTWEGIVDAANEIGAAVIVMGSRGLTGAREVFEGSLSHQVAEHARRPVLVVPPART